MPHYKTYQGPGAVSNIASILTAEGTKKVFAVCSPFHAKIIEDLKTPSTIFTAFTPNPNYSEIMLGIALFNAEACDIIISIGGGSAIDVAKCINIMNPDGTQHGVARCKHITIPTTAGTGSEATPFAVVYKNGEKLSVEHPTILPEYVILDPDFLATLPLYHKKSAMLDALCQAIESIWARGATKESREYAAQAIPIILKNAEAYISGNRDSSMEMLLAANLAGKAIAISKTTAAHAMSYKLSAMFDVAHGHAVALCMPYVWRHLLETTDASLLASLNTIAKAMDATSPIHALDIFCELAKKYAPPLKQTGHMDIGELVASVNPERLGNYPAYLSVDDIEGMYRKL